MKNKTLKARKKDPKSRSYLKSREKPVVSATCQKKRISLAKFMYRSHKSNVTNYEWHFLFVVVFTVGFQNEVIFRKPTAKMQSSLGSQCQSLLETKNADLS